MSESLDLESEVQRLLGLVDRLTLRVVSLEDRLAEVERFGRSEAGASERGAPSVTSQGGSSAWTSVTSAVTPILPEDTAGREELARHIGRFLKRGLAGEFRGSSGRDRLRLQNRYYLICRDFHGANLPEPLLAHSFAEVRNQCKRGSECGASLFVGFATLWEARLATLEAGLPLPAALRNA